MIKVFSKRGYLFLAFICIFSTSYCQLKKAPQWVKEIPITDDAFYGVGMADMKQYVEYRAKARTLALREVMEKIYVSISSSSSLTMTYANDQVDYLLDETISTASSNFLSGHQKMDEWIDKRANTYYVLFKLDVDTYKENRKAYFESLEVIIQHMYDEATDLFVAGEVARGASKLSESINRLDEELNRLIEPEYGIILQKWRLKSIYELEKQIDQISFDLDRKYEFEATARKPLTIENFLINKTTGTPLNGLSTDLKVIQGDVFSYSFDHENHEALSIYGMFPEKRAAVIQIIATLELDSKIRNLLNPSVQTRFISPPIVVHFSSYRISFEFDGIIDPLQLTGNSARDLLKNIPNDLGLIEVSVVDADYKITLKSIGQVKRSQSGLFQGNVSVEVSLIDLKNKRVVYSYMLPKTYVRVENSDLAFTEAFHRSINRSQDFLVGFVTALCALHL